jgi:hypothetical protein
MSVCWVKAGACGQETAVEATKTGPTTVAVSFTTTCEHVTGLGEELTELDVASEMTVPLNETKTYVTATRHMCRPSCVVPAAVLKAMEATVGIYLPENCAIEFVEGAI